MIIKEEKMQVGSCNKLPHYQVIGTSTAMYIWINEDGRGSYTQWIKGKESFRLWHRFMNMKKNKREFIKLAKETFKRYGK